MQLRVFVLHADPGRGIEGGKIQIFVDDGTFAEAKAATLALIQAAQAQGIPVELVGEIEQHRPDGPQHVHIRRQVEERRYHDHH